MVKFPILIMAIKDGQCLEKKSTTAKDYHGDASRNSLASLTNNASSGIENTIKRLQLRGLVNMGNMCFLNVTLQALLSCLPFQLLKTLKSHHIPEVDYLTLHAFVEFVFKFEEDEFTDTDMKKGEKRGGNPPHY